MYRTQNSVKLPDTDAAGIVFFGHYFRLAHEAYESFMESIGFPLSMILDESDFLLLIAHAESDYIEPLRLGQEYEIAVAVENIGSKSFRLTYTFTNGSDRAVATVSTVHVAVDKKTDETISLPSKLRDSLSQHAQ